MGLSWVTCGLLAGASTLVDSKSSGGSGNVADAGDGADNGCVGCDWFLRRGSLLATVFAKRGSRARRGSRGRAGADEVATGWDVLGLGESSEALAGCDVLCLGVGKEARSGGVDPGVSLPTRS